MFAALLTLSLVLLFSYNSYTNLHARNNNFMQQTTTNHPAAADIEYVALKDLLPSTCAPSSVLGPRNDDDGGGGNE